MEAIVLLKQVMEILEKEFPANLSEEWDNVGLLLGDINSKIEKIQLSLDLTDAVIENAIENKIDLIVTHHPFLFSPINKINRHSLVGGKIYKLIQNNISVYTLHTNLDSAKNGLNTYIAEKLGFIDSNIIEEKKSDEYKLSLFMHENKIPKLLSKIEKNEQIKYCVYENESCLMKENINKRIEIIGIKNQVYTLLEQFKINIEKYEIIKLENKLSLSQGLGRYSNLEKEVEFEDYINEIKNKLHIKTVRAVGNLKSNLKRVAVVNGSGMSFFKKLSKLKIDLFITADIKYHEALDSQELGINLVDVGHYESEVFFSELIIKILKKVEKLEIIIFNDEPVFKFI